MMTTIYGVRIYLLSSVLRLTNAVMMMGVAMMGVVMMMMVGGGM